MAIDIRAIGFDHLEKKLHKLVDKTQKKIVSGALRKESTRTKRRIVANIKGQDLIKTGNMLTAFKGAKVKTAKGSRNFIRIGVENPTRDALGIAPDDPYYYPYSVEFGHGSVEPKPFIRPAVDENKTQSLYEIGQDIGKGIEREAMKS